MGKVMRLLTILLLSCASLNAAIPIIFMRAGTNAVVTDTNVIETDLFFVEAEDFNANGGTYLPSTGGNAFNAKNLYTLSNAVPFIDHDITPTGNDNNYRALSVDVGNPVSADTIYEQMYIGKVNFDWWPYSTETNDWADYTRVFTNATYRVYARMSHGATNHGGILSQVTSDHTLSNQTETVFGHFTNSATGGWFQFATVPLRTNGANLDISLSGETTIRFTHNTTNGSDQAVLNWIQFTRLETESSTTAAINPSGQAWNNPRTGLAFRIP